MFKTVFNPRDDFQTSNMLRMFEGVGAESFFALEEGMPADTPLILGTGTPLPVLPPDEGETLELFSSDAGNDGAVIVLEVLDENFKKVTVVLAPLDGVGAVPLLHPDTGDPFLITRVNSATNRGERVTGRITVDLTVRSVINPAVVYGAITVDAQAMSQAIFTVPADTTWAVTSVFASMRKSRGGDADVTVTVIAGEVGSVLRRVFSFGLQRSGDTSIEFVNSELQKAVGPADLFVEATSSAAGSDVSARVTLRTVEVTE